MKLDSQKRLFSEEISKVRTDIVDIAEQKSLDATMNEVRKIAVTRDMPELRQIVESFLP